jgi:hypothetical protein
MGTSADSIRVSGEGDLLEVARVARSPWQSWVRQGIIAPAAEGLHPERDVVEALVVGLLTGALDLRRTKAVWRLAQDDVLAACLALPLDRPATLDAIIDLHTWQPRSYTIPTSSRRPSMRRCPTRVAGTC